MSLFSTVSLFVAVYLICTKNTKSETINTIINGEYKDKNIECDGMNNCNIICDETDSCFNSKILCPTFFACDITCSGINSCQNAEISCPINAKCTVNCNNNNSCRKSIIYAQYSSLFNLMDCSNGDASCNGITIYFPPHRGNTPRAYIYGADHLTSTVDEEINFYAIYGWYDIKMKNYDSNNLLTNNENAKMHCLPDYSSTCDFALDSYACSHEYDICNNPPTQQPTSSPTKSPTNDPTMDPTIDPTMDPTMDPTSTPTKQPTATPTSTPTSDPTTDPTAGPTLEPTQNPTLIPTLEPTLPGIVAIGDDDGVNLDQQDADSIGEVDILWVVTTILITILIFIMAIIGYYVYRHKKYGNKHQLQYDDELSYGNKKGSSIGMSVIKHTIPSSTRMGGIHSDELPSMSGKSRTAFLQNGNGLFPVPTVADKELKENELIVTMKTDIKDDANSANSSSDGYDVETEFEISDGDEGDNDAVTNAVCHNNSNESMSTAHTATNSVKITSNPLHQSKISKKKKRRRGNHIPYDSGNINKLNLLHQQQQSFATNSLPVNIGQYIGGAGSHQQVPSQSHTGSSSYNGRQHNSPFAIFGQSKTAYTTEPSPSMSAVQATTMAHSPQQQMPLIQHNMSNMNIIAYNSMSLPPTNMLYQQMMQQQQQHQQLVQRHSLISNSQQTISTQQQQQQQHIPQQPTFIITHGSETSYSNIPQIPLQEKPHNTTPRGSITTKGGGTDGHKRVGTANSANLTVKGGVSPLSTVTASSLMPTECDGDTSDDDEDEEEEQQETPTNLTPDTDGNNNDDDEEEEEQQETPTNLTPTEEEKDVNDDEEKDNKKCDNDDSSTNCTETENYNTDDIKHKIALYRTLTMTENETMSKPDFHKKLSITINDENHHTHKSTSIWTDAHRIDDSFSYQHHTLSANDNIPHGPVTSLLGGIFNLKNRKSSADDDDDDDDDDMSLDKTNEKDQILNNTKNGNNVLQIQGIINV